MASAAKGKLLAVIGDEVCKKSQYIIPSLVLLSVRTEIKMTLSDDLNSTYEQQISI